MADTLYTDKNGVSWMIIASGGKFFGTADPASATGREYSPLQPDTSIRNDRATVITEIESYAAFHRADVVLRVTASRGGGGGVLLVLLLVALAMADE